MSERGQVKWFNEKKGYGFIARSGGQKDVFVHAQDLAKTGLELLAEGDEVVFDVQTTPRGTKAVSVRMADGAAPPGSSVGQAAAP